MPSRLSQNTCLPLLFFLNKSNKITQLEYYERHRFLIKTLLISQKFLSAFCENGEMKDESRGEIKRKGMSFWDLKLFTGW